MQQSRMLSSGCAVCGDELDGESAAVLEGTRKDGTTAIWYEPFLEDLRTSWPERGTHPACYASQHGIDKLLELIHTADARSREGFYEMANRVTDLEVKLDAKEKEADKRSALD